MRQGLSDRSLGRSFVQPAHAWGKRQNVEIADAQDQFGLGHLKYVEQDMPELTPVEDSDSDTSSDSAIEESYRRFPTDREVSDFRERCNRVVAALQSSPSLANKHVIMETHREVFNAILSRIDPEQRHRATTSANDDLNGLPVERLVHLRPSDSGTWRAEPQAAAMTLH